MRRILLSLLAAGFCTGSAFATCVQPQTQQALDVIGLKSTLMVSALACGDRDQYNQFMDKFQPHVFSELHVLDGYFKQLHGRRGQSSEDNYMTSLANVQSTAGIHEGTNFCNTAQTVFTQVLALKSSDELDQYVQKAPPMQPIVAVACGIPQTESFQRVAELVEETPASTDEAVPPRVRRKSRAIHRRHKAK